MAKLLPGIPLPRLLAVDSGRMLEYLPATLALKVEHLRGALGAATADKLLLQHPKVRAWRAGGPSFGEGGGSLLFALKVGHSRRLMARGRHRRQAAASAPQGEGRGTFYATCGAVSDC